jgi:hypothetical protein
LGQSDVAALAAGEAPAELVWLPEEQAVKASPVATAAMMTAPLCRLTVRCALRGAAWSAY